MGHQAPKRSPSTPPPPSRLVPLVSNDRTIEGLKRTYVRGLIELEDFEAGVERALRTEPTAPAYEGLPLERELR